MDNGPEMTSHDFAELLEPGEPNQNDYIEQVRAIADDWLTQYNEYRSHDAQGGVPPKQFMPRLINTTAADSRNQQGELTNRWEALTRYLDDPRLLIDNIHDEQQIRP